MKLFVWQKSNGGKIEPSVVNLDELQLGRGGARGPFLQQHDLGPFEMHQFASLDKLAEIYPFTGRTE